MLLTIIMDMYDSGFRAKAGILRFLSLFSKLTSRDFLTV